MHRTLCVMAFLALCVGLGHSFHWDIVVATGKRLKFIDNNGSLTYIEKFNLGTNIRCLTYVPEHNRLLFADCNNVYSYDIASRRTVNFLKYDNGNGTMHNLVYDPATMLLIYNLNSNIYAISRNPKTKQPNNNKTKHHKYIRKRLNFNNERIKYFAVDFCGGFIYWTHNYLIKRARFDGSESEVVINTAQNLEALIIDQHSQKMYWYDTMGSITSADLDGKNKRTIIQYSSYSNRPYLSNIKHLAVSKDFIYFRFLNMETLKYSIQQIQKNSPDMKPKHLIQLNHMKFMIAKYNIEDIIQENENCESLDVMESDPSEGL